MSLATPAGGITLYLRETREAAVKDHDDGGDGILLALEGADWPRADATLPMARLNARTLLALHPDEIACALFAPGHDATQVVARLETMGYRGLITVVAPPLPDPRMVERELRALGPGLRLRLVCRD
ncbi:MAG: hypothetical protein QM656_08250 [Paracoccaceae bacterium]